MNESQLRTIEQIEQFFKSSALVKFSAHGDDTERYAYVSCVLKRLDYPQQNKRKRGVLLGLPSAYQRLQPSPSHPAAVIELSVAPAKFCGRPVPQFERYALPRAS